MELIELLLIGAAAQLLHRRDMARRLGWPDAFTYPQVVAAIRVRDGYGYWGPRPAVCLLP